MITMKKIVLMFLSVLIVISISGCGSKSDDNNSNSTTPSINNSIVPIRAFDKTDSGAVLNEIKNDFKDTAKALQEKEQEMFESVGESYEEYLENKAEIETWIELCKKETTLLFERTNENSALYFELISKDPNHEDDDFLDDATDDYYDTVYDDALDVYYEELYDDAADDLYDQFYDGVIDDAYKNLEYKEWSEQRSEAYKTWTKLRSFFYKSWARERSYAYGLWSKMRSEMIWNDNYEVSEIISDYNVKQAEKQKKADQRDAIYEKAQDDAKDIEIKYSVMSNGNAEVVGFDGDGNYATISSDYEGHPVTRVADHAFENNKNLQLITIWADLEEIGNSAFKNTGLLDISIPSETTTIGDHAFEDCTQLFEAIVWGQPSIGNYAFANCKSLENVSISSDTPFVGNHAYDGCESIESLIIWGTEVIGDYAFANCKLIEDISIPSSVKSIGNHAFDGCTKLSSVIVWGRDTAIGIDAFANCSNLKDAPEERGSVIPVVSDNSDHNDSNYESDSSNNEARTDLVNGMRPEFVEAMDSYEAYYDSYCEILKQYNDNPNDAAVVSQYMDLLSKLEEMDEKFEAWDDGTMNDAEMKYYLQVNSRIMQKLADTY